MKLARPDVFHPVIVLAGCRQMVEGDGDDANWSPRSANAATRPLAFLGRSRGGESGPGDPACGVDYTERRDEFLAWTTRVKNLLNPPPSWPGTVTSTICWTWPPPVSRHCPRIFSIRAKCSGALRGTEGSWW